MQPRHKELLLGIAFVAIAAAFATYHSRETGEEIILADASDSFDASPENDPLSAAAQETTSEETPAAVIHADYPATKELVLGKNETLASLLTRTGIPKKEAEAALKSLKKVVNPKTIKAKQKLSLDILKNDGTSVVKFVKLNFSPEFGRSFTLEQRSDGTFAAQENKHKITKAIVRAEGGISSGLYSDAKASGVPNSVTNDLVRLFSYNIDLQRQLKVKDRFDVAYEVKYDETTGEERPGHIIFAKLTLSKKPVSIYRHKISKGTEDYYDQNGKSIRKSLLRTPVDGARLSSKFGMRRHPISGYTKMHQGIDFAAPTGTPIHVAGNGVITQVGYDGGYGKAITVKHNNEYATKYAHLSRFAKVKVGQAVTQRQVIGYVGSTGHSTGPHLHFEVHRHGKKINPQSVKMIDSQVLDKKEMQRFQVARAGVERKVASLPTRTKLAFNTLEQ